MENTIIKSGDMSCQGCVRTIGGLLAGLSGVVSADVSLESAEARVAFDPQVVSRAVLVNAIEDAGFDAE